MTPQSFEAVRRPAACRLRAGDRAGQVLPAGNAAGVDAQARAPARTGCAGGTVCAARQTAGVGARGGRGDDHQRKLLLPRRQAVHAFAHAGPAAAACRPAPGARLRIWSAAASTGQEAYSLAMLVAESRALAGRSRVEILGTDIAREAVGARARGRLHAVRNAAWSADAVVGQIFPQGGGTGGASLMPSGAWPASANGICWPICGRLASSTSCFAATCLIYFDQVTKSRVLDAIARQLAPDGLLYLGGAETVLGITDRLIPSGLEHGVYGLQTKPAAARHGW